MLFFVSFFGILLNAYVSVVNRNKLEIDKFIKANIIRGLAKVDKEKS